MRHKRVLVVGLGIEGVALARYAKQRGARRVAVVLGEYGAGQAQAFTATAEDLGLTVAGVIRTTPQTGSAGIS